VTAVRLGIRGKQFFLSLALILIVVLTSGFYLEHELMNWLKSDLENELLRLCRLARQVVEESPAPFTPETMDREADKLGEATTARVSVIAEDGTLVGDSYLSVSDVLRAENHLSRKEIKEAAAKGYGSEVRFSATVSKDMLYEAVPFRRADAKGFIRVAMPLTDISRLVHRLRLLIFFAGIVGLLVAVGISGFSSHYIFRAFRSLVENTRAIANGEKGRLFISSEDEIGGLAGSINRMSEELENVVSALTGERDLLGAVLEGISDAVIALDEKEHVVLVNQAAVVMLELMTSPKGKYLVEIIRVPAIKDLLTKIKNMETVSAEIDLTGKSIRRVLVRATPLRTGGSVLVLGDITELRRLETIRKDFVANVSHELRTPVSIIRANAETLLNGGMEEPDRAALFIEAMLRNAERLSSIIADLMDLSKIEAGQLKLDLESHDVESVLRRAMEMMSKAAQERKHELALRVEPSLSARFDPKALEQVIANLLENAVKYTKEGGHIQIKAYSVDEGVRIEVEDDGPGIEMRHRERIFERFYRVDPGRSREMGGTGLGLSIVKHIVDVMGGRVGMEPADTHGSIFWIFLPNL
jgi:two-component system, OmpR family, phosphate regulon sensor histidine kinase PhoR